MTRPYSNDLRERVVTMAQSSPNREAGSALGVSAASVSRWCNRKRQTGSVAPAKMGGYRKPILLSDIPVHREQAPLRAIYFDPRNASELAARFGEMIGNSAPTFDPVAERQALGNYALRQVEFAKQFLEIATTDNPFADWCCPRGWKSPDQSQDRPLVI